MNVGAVMEAPYNCNRKDRICETAGRAWADENLVLGTQQDLLPIGDFPLADIVYFQSVLRQKKDI